MNYRNGVRYHWTAAQVAELRRLAFQGLQHKEIAARLGKSYKSIANKATQLARIGRPLPNTRSTHLKRVETKAMPLPLKRVFIRAREEGYTISRLADKAGLSRGSVKNMAVHGNPTIGAFLALANAVGFDVSLRLRADEQEAFRAEDAA